MKSFSITSAQIASLEWKGERKGKITHVDLYEYVSDAGDVVVKIVTDDNYAGVGAEYAFIEYKYPGYKMKNQALIKVTINGDEAMCDELTVSNGDDEKRIFFDITDFFGKSD